MVILAPNMIHKHDLSFVYLVLLWSLGTALRLDYQLVQPKGGASCSETNVVTGQMLTLIHALEPLSRGTAPYIQHGMVQSKEKASCSLLDTKVEC